MRYECPDPLFLSLSAVSADWFSNADSLRESFRIASSLDWANIDLTSHPGQYYIPVDYMLSLSALELLFSSLSNHFGMCASRSSIFLLGSYFEIVTWQVAIFLSFKLKTVKLPFGRKLLHYMQQTKR